MTKYMATVHPRHTDIFGPADHHRRPGAHRKPTPWTTTVTRLFRGRR